MVPSYYWPDFPAERAEEDDSDPADPGRLTEHRSRLQALRELLNLSSHEPDSRD